MSPTLKILTNDEAVKLLDALVVMTGTHKKLVKSVRNYAIAVLMLDAGLRVGEVIRLHKAHLCYLHQPVKSIIIDLTVAEKAGEREVPVSQRLCEAIKNLHDYCWPAENTFMTHYAFFRPGHVEPLTTRQVERIIRVAALAALGRPIHPHILRHTFATRLMKVTDIRTVQTLLGHKRLSSTQVYTHPNSEDLTKAIAGIQQPTCEEIQPGMKKFLPANVPNRGNAPGTTGDVS